MSDKVARRVWLEIDMKKLCSNFNKIKEAVKPLGIIAVLKANAYGLGVNKIAHKLAEAGAAGFAVAELNEALEVIKFGKPVQILGNVLPDEIPDAVNAGIILPVNDLETAKAISRESVKQNKTTECNFLVDTGMGRLGIVERDAFKTITEVVKLPNLNCSGIYSHFPVAYQTGSEFTKGQCERLLGLIADLKKHDIEFKKIHIANSDGINNFSFTYQKPFTHVRTGINLYGSFDSEGQRVMKLESVLALKTRVVGVRMLPAGMTIGYGCTYRLPKETKVGVIAAGYADGLPLALSNRGYVLVRGELCPVLGRVSMDYTTISLEHVPDVKCGDEVICLGGSGINAITVDSWAQLKGTHPYEIICSFGNRVERRYIDDAL